MKDDMFYDLEMARKCLEVIQIEVGVGALIESGASSGYNIVAFNSCYRGVVRSAVEVFKAGVRFGRNLA